MEERELYWSLEDLYPSFESEAFHQDYQSCLGEIQGLNQWSEENFSQPGEVAKKLKAYLEKKLSLMEKYVKLSRFAHLTQSTDAKHPQASIAKGRLEEAFAEVTKAEVLFKKWLKGLDNLDEIIAGDGFLEEHRFHIQEQLAYSKHLLSDGEELLLAKLTNTGGTAWSSLQQLLTSTLLVDIELGGEKKQLPLPVVRNLAYDKNPEVRKTAYEAELKSYSKIVESSAAALNGIKGEYLTVSKMRGFASPLDATLFSSRMSRQTLEAMLAAMVEALPHFHRFYRQKAKLLGHGGGLPFYDLFAPMGSVDRTYTFPEAIDYVIKNFYGFSEDLGKFAEKAYRGKWIDVPPRQGKRGGAFCSNIHPIKQSRFLLNFTGSMNNVTTLAHELGHGYHGSCLGEESLLNSSYPMPLAETASIFAETILVKDILEKGTKEEQFWILENSISDAGQVIVDIYSRFLFEQEVFSRRADHQLSVDELKEIMLDAQKQAYGDGLDHEVLHPYMWVNKVHYYYPERHFYNFPYAFGQLFSLGLFAQYLKEKDTFPKKYVNLLKATGKMSVEDVAKIAGIDITDIEFWRSSLGLIIGDIEKFIALSEESLG